MKPTEVEFQRAGLLAVLAALASNPAVDVALQLAIKQSTMEVLNDHPVNDNIETRVRFMMR